LLGAGRASGLDVRLTGAGALIKCLRRGSHLFETRAAGPSASGGRRATRALKRRRGSRAALAESAADPGQSNAVPGPTWPNLHKVAGEGPESSGKHAFGGDARRCGVRLFEAARRGPEERLFRAESAP
jgi:hypothetical protein